MSSEIDTSWSKAKVIVDEVSARISEIESEQDARLQLINRFLTEVLGWQWADIRTEPHNENGYTDYLLQDNGRNLFVVEAKRVGKTLIDTKSQDCRSYKVGGPALASAMEGISQAASYCLSHGVNFAVLTTGVVWIAFLPFPGDGCGYRDGTAIVFPSLESILKNFAKFHDLFAKSSIKQKVFRVVFNKEDGLVLTQHVHLESVIAPETVRILPKNALAFDLDQIFKEFFSSMSGDNDPDMLRNCFVETRESKIADAGLEKIVRNITANIRPLSVDADNELAQVIESSLEIERGDTVLIVGHKGSGKSTFIERFFELILERSVRDRCFLVRINLQEASGHKGNIVPWLTSRMIDSIERQLFSQGIPTYDDLQGLYYGEYVRWRDGHYKPLYQTNKTDFKVKFGEYLHDQVKQDSEGYLKRLLADVVRNRKLMPCLVFDNTDHFPQSFQEEVFQFSQSIRSSVSHTFVILPVTDHSIWRLSKSGPFQTYASRVFYLPVPSPKAVLERRISYIKERAEKGQGNKNAKQYFLSRGIRISVEDIMGFAACVEEAFINTDFMSRRVGWIANHDIRRTLNVLQRIMTSSMLSIEELIASYLAKGAVRIHFRKLMQGLLFGDYNAYQEEENAFVCNLFAVDSDALSSPLLRVRILKALVDQAGEVNNHADAYLSVSQLEKYFEPAGISDIALHKAIKVLLSYRLIEPYDPSDDSVFSEQRVAISHSGRMHLEMIGTDPIYISHMAFATPIRDMVVVERLRSTKNARMSGHSWEQVRRVFVQYCMKEDDVFCRIPLDPSYDGQRQVRQDLLAQWVDDSRGRVSDDSEGNASPEIIAPHLVGQSFAEGTVTWFNPERGFGFVSLSGGSSDAFIHAKTLRESGWNELGEGDKITCDTVPSRNGLLVIKVHSVERFNHEHYDELDLLEGVFQKFDQKKGFGFIYVPSMDGDVFVHSKILERCGFQYPAVGTRVLIAIGPGQNGKGRQATYVRGT